MIRRIGLVAGATGLLTLLLPCLAQTLVKNPSFENNISETWPFYGPIDDWQAGSGVNEAGGPFHNNGTPVPDGQRVGFRQGTGLIAQDLSGLTAGKRYWIQFHYDARQGSDLDLLVKFSTVNQGGALDETLDTINKPKPAVTTGSPYYSRSVPFTPDADGGTLTFEVVSRGDSTVLLDAVTLVQRDEGNFAVMNPSFEASGTVYNGSPSVGTDWPAISGWAKVGVAGVDDGTGGQANNGTIPEQALVAFISDVGSLTQTLSPLVPEDNYQLSFAYNAKSGTTPHLQVLVGGAVVWERDVTAVGGTQPYARQSLTFKATGPTSSITFSNTVASTTVLLDEVKVLGKTGSTLPPIDMVPAKLALRVGEEGTGTLTIPNERLAAGPAVIKLRSANPKIFVFPDADAAGVLTLTFQGTTSQSYRFQGTGVGNAAVEIIDAAGVPFPTDITAVYVAQSTFVLNPSFELDRDSGVATAPVSGWTTGGANIGMASEGNAFLSADDLTIPDRRAVLRIQGSGGTVSQMVKGLKAGQLYGLQFFYNSRTTGNPYELALQVSFAGQQLANIPNIIPAAQSGLTDYYFQELRFTPTTTTTSGVLEFKTVVSSGDATLFLDAVSIVPRLANEVAVMNSSFEASAMGANWPGYLQPNRVAGWLNAGGGYGVNAYSPDTFFVEPFLDNGINSDQDNAFFGQGAVSAKQTISGLTTGQAYTLVFDYNFRDGRPQNGNGNPTTGQIEVSVDGTIVLTTEEQPPVDTLSPWPGFRHANPFYQAFIPFTAAAGTAELQISHAGVAGDETLLLDNVRLVPGTRTPPTLNKSLTDQTVDAGANVTFSVAPPANGLSYRWLRNGVALTDGAGISGTSTATLTLSQSKASDSGTYSVLATDGLGVVGSAALLTVNAPPPAPTLSVAKVPAGIELRWPAAASGFRLQKTSSLGGFWGDVLDPVVGDGNDNVVTVPTDGDASYFRLTD